MKARLTAIAILTVILAGSALWSVSRHLKSQKNAPTDIRKILYFTCSMHPSVRSATAGSCPICGMELEAVYGNAASTNNQTADAASVTAKPKPYPLNVCVVDGMELGSMGAPYVFVYQGQEVKFCCAGCKPDFLKNAPVYMKKLEDAEAAATK